MKKYLKLMRVHHYIKNLLIFVPVFFGKGLINKEVVIELLIAFVTFCFISSAIYILNDIQDVESDRKHPTKKNRPIASGDVSVTAAYVIFAVLFAISAGMALYRFGITGAAVLLTYFGLNVFYSLGAKNMPILDIVILASGFVLRIIYGSVTSGVFISKWLYLVVITGALFMGLGKRRNELKQQKDSSRKVLKYYTESFLDKNMYVCVALVNVFYSLWAVDFHDARMVWTVPIVIVILMKYSLDIEGDSDGDPVSVILHDKMLMAIVAAYIVIVFAFLYIL